ncbi:unnamed protein product [Rhodiola kirilowii]
MASDAPRERIDQFFASKKRKAVSPGSKSGRSEKNAKTNLEVSPSSKGTLDNFLANTQLITSSKDHESPPRNERVKRNLTAEINYSMGNAYRGENDHVLAVEKSVASVCDVAGVDLVKDTRNPAQGTENVELNNFATEFLSVCCGALTKTSRSTLNVHKRHGSSTELLEKEYIHKNSQQIGDSGQPTMRDAPTSQDKTLESVELKDVISRTPRGPEVSTKTYPDEIHGSLRKCNKVSNCTGNVSSDHTPGAMTVKPFMDGTPKSSRGSSFSSPGEEFWREAIAVADGLVPNDISLDQNQTSQHVSKTNQNLVSMHASRNKNLDKMPEEPFDKCENRVQMETVTSSHLTVKQAKSSVKYVSPLPVKHFDFSSEGKNLAESIMHHITAESIEGTAHDHYKKPDSGECRGDETTHIVSTTLANNHLVTATGDAIKLKKSASHPRNDVSTLNFQVKENQNMNKTQIPDIGSTPSSYKSLQDHLDIGQWLPQEICSIYRKRGMSRLYPWQVECLQVDGVLERRNLVYCASTSAGKSFVAEILMLRRVVLLGKMALLVLPYVSICSEKAEHLEVLMEPLGKRVRSYYGNQGGGTLPKDTSIAVCTIEKANSLINRLLEEGRLSEVGIIVIDELHMVGDQHRGYLLELILTKLRYAAGEGNGDSSGGESSGSSSSKGDNASGLQIVGMSATMPNVAAVSNWLQAALYQTDFRPVPLEEYIKVGDSIYDKSMHLVRTMPKAANLGGKDPDHIVALCDEVVQEGNSVLIFCSSRKGCESTAVHVSRYLKNHSVKPQNDNDELADISSAIDALRKCPAGLDPILGQTLPSGVAYHHAGLTVEERDIVETCYRKGLVRVLMATSTLAAGVNLPARRVIFRQPRVGRDFIDGTRYRQMAGRAGRTGIDTKGESVLICKPEEIKRIKGILNDGCPPLESCLSEDKNGMTHAILEVVAGGIVQSANDINRYVRCTLLNSTKPFDDVVKSAKDSLRWLCHRKFIEWNEESKIYSTTPLGRAAFGSSLCPEESLIVLDDLSRAREGFVLASDLHLVYLITPINVDLEPDWELYYERFMELSTLDQAVGNRVGVAEPFLMRMAHGAPIRKSVRSNDNPKTLHDKSEKLLGVSSNKMLSDEQMLRVCKRFYVALMLSRLVQETPVTEVCEAFKVVRGMVQALQENAGRFASMVSVFCERLGWNDFEGLVAKFQNRVCFGVRAEIVELTNIQYVKGSRARALYTAGFRTPQAIAEASVHDLVKALFESSSWTAQENVTQRRMHLGIAKKIKNGARKIVLEKAEEARLAAFSAFKSLGFDYPHMSQPILPIIVENLPEQGNGPTSSGEHSHASTKLLIGGSENPSDSGDAVVQVLPKSSLPSSNYPSPVEVNGNIPTPAQISDLTRTNIASSDGGKQDARSKGVQSPGLQLNAYEKGPLNASNAPGGFDCFLGLWDSVQEYYFDIHFNKRSDINSFPLFEIHGIAICWENSPVYYINLPKDLLNSTSKRNDPSSITNNNVQASMDVLEMAKHRWNEISRIIGKGDIRKVTWNLKMQIQALKSPTVSIQRFGSSSTAVKSAGIELVDSSYCLLPPVHISNGIDLSIAAWILWPDDERSSSPSLEKEVKKRLSVEAASAAGRSGRWRNQMRRAAHNGCCRRVALVRALSSVLWNLLEAERLTKSLESTEIPLVNILADMELWGIGVDMEGCLQARHLLGEKLRLLEKEAYRLAGTSFSLYMASDVANILYNQLKLPLPEGKHQGKQHPSTDKHCLDLLRHEHPIVPIIKEHRTLAKLLNCTLGSICSMAKLSTRTQRYTLHGHWLQTSTATGRLSMEEPNLQCVEHPVEFFMTEDDNDESCCDPKHHKVNAREFFIPTQENWLLLTADYSQIELRLMAHFSKDSMLIDLLRKPDGDVFTMIGARWTGKSEVDVSPKERDQTKRLIYGILYGMGANSLAEQLDCSSDEAAQKIQSFKNTFPGVSSWLSDAVALCRQKGYIETLNGRKRFLSKIKLGNSTERSKAQRQAINSICQGSAADIIKIAMINIYSEICENGVSLLSCSMLKGRCRVLLQVHDELVLEVDPSVLNQAALLLQKCMENAAELLVPLHVKLKVGRAWGSLEPFQAKLDQQSHP